MSVKVDCIAISAEFRDMDDDHPYFTIDETTRRGKPRLVFKFTSRNGIPRIWTNGPNSIRILRDLCNRFLEKHA